MFSETERREAGQGHLGYTLRGQKPNCPDPIVPVLSFSSSKKGVGEKFKLYPPRQFSAVRTSVSTIYLQNKWFLLRPWGFNTHC